MTIKPKIWFNEGKWWVTWPDGSKFSYQALEIAAKHTAEMLKIDKEARENDSPP